MTVVKLPWQPWVETNLGHIDECALILRKFSLVHLNPPQTANQTKQLIWDKRTSSGSIVCLGKLAASLSLKLFINSNMLPHQRRSLAHEQNSSYKCKRHKSIIPEDQQIYNNTVTPAVKLHTQKLKFSVKNNTW